ncbi:hypothetical protein RND81_03G242500 [Saponaria officinalis]|uniref:TLC domain-containing protein n=1 Tax=Saponaria officinalis TaxID=3572 RepID=A0AAW1M2N0_SAPOF
MRRRNNGGWARVEMESEKEKKGKKEMGRERREKVGVGVVGWMYTGALLIWGAWIGLEIACDGRTDLITVVASFFLFQTANIILRSFVSTDPVLVNTSVSLLHSSLSSSLVLFILLNQWRSAHPSLRLFDHDELVRNTWPFAFKAISLSCGYFAYDQSDMLYHRLYSGCFPSVLAHHFILLLCFSLALFLNVTLNYLLLTLLCELHSVFLHLRKVRRMAGFRNSASAIVKLEWLLNWSTFIFARLIPHALILIKLVRDAPKFDKGIQLPLACFGMIAMNVLNIGLGFDLFAAYVRDHAPPLHHHTH